ncbi:MAG: redoxin domain-containing protein [Acidiferrobacteraceae bacterium]
MMQLNRRTVLVSLALGLVLVVAFVGFRVRELVPDTIRAWQQRDLVHGMAPPLMERSLEGRRVSLADLRGKPVLLHFWATWCGTCRLEQPSIEAIARDYQVITVATDGSDTAALKKYVKSRGIKTTVIGDRSALAARFGVRGVPTDVVVDGRGQIRSVKLGYSSQWSLRFRLWLAGRD